MEENTPNENKNQPPDQQQPFDYQAHYTQQNQQYQYPQSYGGYSDNTRAFSVLSYISVLWLVGLLAEPNNQKVRFHVNQGIILTIFQVVLTVALSIVKSLINIVFIQAFSGIFFISHLGMFVNGLLSLVSTCLFLAYMVIGILHAAQDRQVPLPIIGSLFQVLK